MRRRSVVKRELTPDVKYNSELIARLINTIMTRGKKATAEGIVYDALDLIQSKKADMPAIDVFTRLWKMSNPNWKSKAVASAVPPIRCPLKSIPNARSLWQCAGSSAIPAAAKANP